MGSLVIPIQIIATILSLLSVAILLKQKHSNVAISILVAAMGCFVYNFGYLLVVTATSEDVAILALRVEYIGTGFLYIAFARFIFLYCNIKIPTYFFRFWICVETLVQILVWLTKYNNLYYKSLKFVKGEYYSYFDIDRGIIYTLRVAIIVLATLCGTYVIYKKILSTHSKRKKSNYKDLLTAQFITLFSFLLTICGVLSTYDTIPLFSMITIGIVAVKSGSKKMLSIVDLGKESVIDTLIGALIIVEDKMEYVYANQMAIELFSELNSIVEGDIVSKQIQEIFQYAESQQEYKINDKYYSCVVRKLVQEKKVVGYGLTLFDVTNRHELLMGIKEAKKKADYANKAKSEFLANMSHEIRTPINAILGMDELILREEHEDNILLYAHNIKVAGNGLLSLVNDILDISKIESGRMEVIKVEYDLSSILSDIVMMISLKAEAKGLELKLDFSEDIPHILYGDDKKIKQSIINLLTNAVKYTEKGKITFHLSTEKGEEEDDIFLKVSIEDTGIGIKKENIPKLFDSFMRLDQKRNRYIEGTGLGISITSKFLELMGGKLNIDSIYGVGSNFYFSVPQKIISHEPIGNFEETYRKSLKTKTKYKESFIAPDASILVVDDNEMNLQVVKGLLKLQKIKITTASSGMECLQLIKKNKYDIIFLDHMMPNMDGIETLQKMKKDTENISQDSIIIALTANAITGAEQMYLDAGFDDYLTKPIDCKVLENMICKYLPDDLILKPEKKEVIDNNTEESDLLEYDIDVNAALSLIGGNKELYREIIDTYTKNSGNIRNKMLEYIDSNNMKEYAILVHALKGDSRALGAEILGDIAFEHEKQSKQNNISYVKENWDKLCEEWDKVLEGLNIYQSKQNAKDTEKADEESLKNIEEDKVIENLKKVCDYIDDFNEDKALEILNDLLKCNIKEEYRDCVEKAIQDINDYDSESAEDKIKNIVG